MTRFLLDTNILIAIMRDHAAVVQQTRSLEPGSLATSTLVYFELWYGVSRSTSVAANTERLKRAMNGIEMLALSQEDAKAAGEIRALLQQKKQPIGPYDTLIAGQALARGLTLITANEREFRRVPGLRLENWLLPRR